MMNDDERKLEEIALMKCVEEEELCSGEMFVG